MPWLLFPGTLLHEDLGRVALWDVVSEQTTSCSAGDVTEGSKGWGARALSLFITRANLRSRVRPGFFQRSGLYAAQITQED